MRMPNAPMISAPFASVGPDCFTEKMSFIHNTFLDYSRMTVYVNECFCQASFMYTNYFKQIQYIFLYFKQITKWWYSSRLVTGSVEVRQELPLFCQVTHRNDFRAIIARVNGGLVVCRRIVS